ncbi:YhcN/YlaJ family sporulation lipoprotein [Paenibacillus koleovorans]|uniref:YhcN/YlaJ family sporulation lipoprotein n=1 Tax=Paenibacillus koleovorans TaxID=121608 RepID=UPI000FDB5441|nr:YhcN/YlaJ family sporulation lipoprotein [Paenibacillus koleovorans]
MRYWIIMVLLAAVLSGCGKGSTQPAPSEDWGSNGPNDGVGQVKVQQTVPDKPEIKDKKQVRARLEALAASIPQVHGAKCVVLGNTAIVGIDVDPNLERSRVDVIKYSVAEALAKDPYGVHAFVTADLGLNGRIREMREEMDRGRPIAGFAEEVADIIGRIVPQLPKAITPQNNPPAESEDRKQLNNKDM